MGVLKTDVIYRHKGEGTHPIVEAEKKKKKREMMPELNAFVSKPSIGFSEKRFTVPGHCWV